MPPIGNCIIAQCTDRRTRAIARANRIRAARVSADGIRAALTASRGIFAKDRSRSTRLLRAHLRARLTAFRKAQRGAIGTPGLVLDQAIVDRLRKVPTKDFPNPEPAPDLRGLSALTLTCPAAGKPSGVSALNGTLAPVLNGAEVQLHITSPGGTEAVQTATTDATGAYTGSFTAPSTGGIGTWTIFARFAGNANFQPDDSPICRVVVT